MDIDQWMLISIAFTLLPLPPLTVKCQGRITFIFS